MLKERGDRAVPFKGVFVPLPFLSVLSTATLSQGEQLSATMPFYVMFLFHRHPIHQSTMDQSPETMSEDKSVVFDILALKFV